MDWLSTPRTWIIAVVSVLGIILLWQVWVWEIERVEVPPDTFLIKINKWGKDLPPGEIIAPDDSYKGVQRQVLPEGRQFLNPLFHSYETAKMLVVPEGKCAVLTRRAGTELSSERVLLGEYLAQGNFDPSCKEPLGERGILEKTLPPQKYRINPYEYSYELVPAVEVARNEVGVYIRKWGKDPAELHKLLNEGKKQLAALRVKDGKEPEEKVAKGHIERWLQTKVTDEKLHAWLLPRVLQDRALYVVPEGYRGVWEQPLPPGTKYLNPYVEAIIPVGVGKHSVEFTDIVFPSKDGFMIQPHMEVAYQVDPKKAAELFVMLCDNGQLLQSDLTSEDQKKNPILQKFVLPLIRGNARIEGSNYYARDYVSQQKGEKTEVTNPRKKLQDVLIKKVKDDCEKVGVVIESITVGKLEMTPELTKLADLINERETTRVARDKNKGLVRQYEQQQKEQAGKALAKQKGTVVEAEQKFKVQAVKAKEDEDVAKSRLENELLIAQEKLEAAREKAKAIKSKATSDAAVIIAKNEAEIAGLKTAIQGFPTPEHYAQYTVIMKISPSLGEIFASDTSEFAKVFSTYMKPLPPRPANGGTPVKGGS